MRKFRALFVQEFLYSIRHLNRELIPLILYGLLSYVALAFGYSRLLPVIENYDTVQWMVPNLVMFYFIVCMFQYGRNSIARKIESGYLTHMRILSASGGGFFTALLLEAFLRGIIKSALLVLLYWLLFGNIGAYISWLLVLAVSVAVGIFWFGIGFIVGMKDKDRTTGSHLLSEIFIPLLAASGLIYPMAFYPGIIEQITYGLPTTLGFYLPRTFFGINSLEIWMIAVLAVWGLVSLFSAFFMLKKASA